MLHQKKKWLTSQDTVFASGTSSRMNGPILPALNKVRYFFDTIKWAFEALRGISNAFCSASNCCSIRLSKSLSSSTLPVNSNRVKYKAHWTSVTRSWKGKHKEQKIQKWQNKTKYSQVIWRTNLSYNNKNYKWHKK